MYLSTMTQTIKPKNRRQFLNKLSISVATVALAPNIIFAQSSINHKISVGFSKTPPEKTIKFSKLFSKNQEFVIKESHLKTDILYIHSGRYNDLLKSEDKLSTNTILIVNQHNFDFNSLVGFQSFCNTNKIFLLIIEENLSESTPTLFNKATLYEPQLGDITKIDTIVKSISFLNQLTQPHQFFTINQSLTLNSINI